MKLVDTLEEQAVLEEELEHTKPPGPPECAHLHYLLAAPFRYGRYPGNARFRREDYSPGVFYAGEAIETAVAETAFYRALFFAESPETPWPRNPLEFTALQVDFATGTAIDLTHPPLSGQARFWTHPTDYAACLDLVDAAREAGIEVIRYRSVRDPKGGANLALMTCRAFARDRPSVYATWRLAFSGHGINAICDRPDARCSFPFAGFANDPRLAKLGPQLRP